WARADTVIWVNPSRATVMRRLTLRTLRRMVTGAELWNGNRERFRFLLSKDESILRWAWRKHAEYQEIYAKAAADPAYGHLRFVCVTSYEELDPLLKG